MRHPTPPFRRTGQQGVSLIFALIALLLIGLSTLALVRSVDTGSLVLGNMSFKQDATAAADQGVRTAFNWLKVQTATTLGADNAAVVPGLPAGVTTRDLLLVFAATRGTGTLTCS